MFNKKYCKNCKKRIHSGHNFCSKCGERTHLNEDWGMLGKQDSSDEFNFTNSLFGSIGGKVLNKMLGSALKMIEKEIKRETSDNLQPPRTHFKLMINGKEVKFQPKSIPQKKKETKINCKNLFEKEQLKKFIKLPKKEPKTNLKRLGNKIIYEIEIPGVKSQKDILINMLENSIEIKAIGKTKSYCKTIPIKIPITNKIFSNGKLILELKDN